jgi:ketosteroid isomerase-like protein
MKPPIHSALLAAGIGAASLSASSAAGQNLPGYHGDYDAADAQYRAYALNAFQEVLAGWAEAVNDGDVEAASRYYADEVTAFFDRPATGAQDVRAALAEWIERIDGFRLGLSDFDASGSMSYGAVKVVVNGADPADNGDGTLVMVLKRRGRDWEIRSQTLVMSESGSPRSAPGSGGKAVGAPGGVPPR